MKKRQLVFVMLLQVIAIAASANNSMIKCDSDTIPSGDTVIYERPEIEASFVGGDEAWMKFLKKNVKWFTAEDNGAPVGSYTVVVQFIVDVHGAITEIKPITSHGFGMEKECIRVMRLSPNWKPAIMLGKPVKSYRRQPFIFKVNNE